MFPVSGYHCCLARRDADDDEVSAVHLGLLPVSFYCQVSGLELNEADIILKDTLNGVQCLRKHLEIVHHNRTKDFYQHQLITLRGKADSLDQSCRISPSKEAQYNKALDEADRKLRRDFNETFKKMMDRNQEVLDQFYPKLGAMVVKLEESWDWTDAVSYLQDSQVGA